MPACGRMCCHFSCSEYEFTSMRLLQQWKNYAAHPARQHKGFKSAGFSNDLFLCCAYFFFISDTRFQTEQFEHRLVAVKIGIGSGQ